MSANVEAIYENGLLRLLEPLAIPDHTRVRVSIATSEDDEADQWRAASEAELLKTWGNDEDEVFNELLSQ